MFAKGTDAEKLILVSLQEGRMDTLFRARAVLAMLTATARTTQVFANLDPEVEYTFLDLLKLWASNGSRCRTAAPTRTRSRLNAA